MMKRTKGILLLLMLVLTGLAGRDSVTTLSGTERRLLLHQLKESRAGLQKSIKGLSNEQLRFTPAPDQWSVQQCVQHLALSEEALWQMAESVLKQPANKSLRSEIKLSDQEVLKQFADRSQKVKTFDQLQPQQAPWKTTAEALEAFREKRSRLLKYVRTTTDDVRSHVAQLPLGTLDAYQVLLLIAAHPANRRNKGPSGFPEVRSREPGRASEKQPSESFAQSKQRKRRTANQSLTPASRLPAPYLWPMATTPELYQLYVNELQRIADVRFANAVLQWDQETYLPPRGAQFRGRQISTLAEIAHQMFTSEKLGGMLQELLGRQDLTEDERRNVELSWEDYSKYKKYTSEFVRRLSEQTNRAFHAWMEARKANRFSVYENALDTLLQLKKQEADFLGYEQHPYNALLNEFEKGCTVVLLDKTFSGLLPVLKDVLQKIAARPQVDDSFLHQHFPRQQQWDWGLFLIKKLNFSFDAGRQDVSEHPFSISLNPLDVRITTRIDEQDFGNMTWSCIHEAGHALYEQGLPAGQYGLPLGEACSYSIHESQSRLWENNIGRSRSFWQHFYPHLQQHFPHQFQGIDGEEFYKGINKVQPSLIRTEADEVSYHFHVFIRYELEKKLLEGSLQTADIPAFWNEQYKKLLNVDVPDDKKGCLQDVHWSHGSFGYFPTYSLGSFYAAQMYAAAQKALPQLDEDIRSGNTASLLDWLRTHIHALGRKLTSEELCKAATGEFLNVNYFNTYILQKYSVIYNLS